MKVRVGFGLGTRTPASGFTTLVDDLERLGFDSLWLSERVGSPSPDPIIGLSVAAGRTDRLKLGTSVQVLPGRNPILLAKAWASLDKLSGGRALPAFGLGVADPMEQQAFGVERAERAAWFDEALPLIRSCWTDEVVDHDGARFSARGLRVLPKPVQQPPDVWLGGRAPSELRRVGRLGDGWLASFSTTGECAKGRLVVDDAAAECGRRVDPEHFGAMVMYSRVGIPDLLAELIAKRNPQADPAEVVADGIGAVRERCEAYLEVGFSKLVLVPIADPESWTAELEELAELVLPIQT